MLVVGDAEGVRAAHSRVLRVARAGKADAGFDGSGMSVARLAILSGLRHYTVFSSPALVTTLGAFLDAAELTER